MNTKKLSYQVFSYLTILLFMLVSSPAFSQTTTRTWTGNADDNWVNRFNWSNNILPNGFSHVIIPDVSTNDPAFNFNVGVLSITIENGGHLTMEAGATLGVQSLTVESGGHFTLNQNTILTINPVDQTALDNDGQVDNEGSIIIDQTNQTSNVNGIDNSGTFNNFEDAEIKVDGVSKYGVFNRSSGTFSNEGLIKVGATTAVGSTAVRNASGGSFDNAGCQALIYVYSTEILGYSGFTNNANIVEEAGSNYNSVINTNNGIVQNLNGGDCLISIDNGIYDTLGIKYWRGCQSKNWQANNNWHDGARPTINDPVVIPFDAENDVHVKTAPALAKSIEIDSLASMVIEANNSLTIDGSDVDGVYNKGSVTIQGTLLIGLVDTIRDRGFENYGTLEISSTGKLEIQLTADVGMEIIRGSVLNDGFIILDNIGNDGIDNYSTFTNNGTIEIGQNGALNSIIDGIENRGTFTNSIGANIIIDNTISQGIDQVDEGGGFINAGTIELGLNGGNQSMGYSGFDMDWNVRNESTGIISIDNTDDTAMRVYGDAIFYNAGQINIGQTGGSGNIEDIGIDLTGFMTNDSTGQIYIDNTRGDGGFVIAHNTTIENFGIIEIGKRGAAENIRKIGLINRGSFFNKSQATLYVGNTKDIGIENRGFFTNTTTEIINSGLLTVEHISESGIYSEELFKNDGSLSILNIDSVGIYIDEDGRFTNNGTCIIDSIGLDGIHNLEKVSNSGSISIDNTGDDGIETSNDFTNKGQLYIGQNGGGKSITGYGIANYDDFDNEDTASIEIVNTKDYGIFLEGNNSTFYNYGSLKVGEVSKQVRKGIQVENDARFRNYDLIIIDNSDLEGIEVLLDGYFLNSTNGNIQIGQNGGDTDSDGMEISDEGTQFNNYGNIEIDNSGSQGIEVRDSCELTNYSTGTIDIGQNDGSITRAGIYSNRGGMIKNLGGIIRVDNTGGEGIEIHNSSILENKDNGQLLIGQSDGNIGGDGLDVYYYSECYNEGGKIVIDNTSENYSDGLQVDNRSTFVNSSDGELLIGQNGSIEDNGIQVRYYSNFYNQDSAVIKIDKVRNDDHAGIFIQNGSEFENNDEADILIGHSGNVKTGIWNESIFSNRSTIDLDISGFDAIYNDEGGTFFNAAGATIFCDKQIETRPSSVLLNNGTITTEYVFINYGEFTGSGDFTVHRAAANYGTFNVTGTFTFTGNDLLSYFYSDSPPTVLNNLVIDKSRGEFAISGGDLQVDGELRLIKGIFILNPYDLILGTEFGTIIGESDTSYITDLGYGGEVVKTIDLNAPLNVNPGNIGVHITSSANLGTTTIRRGHGVKNINGENSISQYYHIDPTNNNNLDATLRFTYLDAHLNNLNERLLEPVMSNDTIWDYYTINTADTLGDYIEISGVDVIDTLTLTEGAIKAIPIVMLEGPFSGSAMNDNLRINGSIPLTEPYTALGYTHVGDGGGETVDVSILYNGNSDAIVDWVFLELRDKNDPDVVLHTRSALLQKDGDIVSADDGVSPVQFSGADADNYYMAIHHRNHLAIMSAAPITMSVTSSLLDFSSDPNIVSGGLLGIKDLGGGYYGLYSGDYDANGQVQNTDANNLIPSIGTSGYLSGDLDMNGEVQNSDLQNNLLLNLGKGVQFNY